MVATWLPARLQDRWLMPRNVFTGGPRATALPAGTAAPVGHLTKAEQSARPHVTQAYCDQGTQQEHADPGT